LVEKSPDHPRREFLQASIERAEALAKLSPQPVDKPTQAAVLPAAAERPPASKPRPAERVTERAPDRVTRTAERSVAQNNFSQNTGAQRSTRDAAPPQTRTYGAPIGEAPPRQSIPLNSPINSPPVTTARKPESSFPGRTVEASDSGFGRTAPPAAAPAQAPVTNASVAQAPGAAGSAAVSMPSAAAPAQAVPDAVDVVPAKIVKRVMPVPPSNLPRSSKGFVVLRFNVGVNGRVSALEVVESEPQGVYDAAAQDAVRKWVYEPRKENGVAVESSAKARLVFDATPN
ncbi:MAG TPA: TonB family protein, partial [Rhizomicrobium sp.]